MGIEAQEAKSFGIPILFKIMVVWWMRRYLMLLETSIVDLV